jgi:hypothetical protein
VTTSFKLQQTNNKTGPGYGKIFNGLSTISFASKIENRNFQHGFKFKKCIRPFKSDVMEIKGNAQNDKFEVIVHFYPKMFLA